jgi:predicted AlkP superfamily phosphohydrolase/phosphomutase/tetratricopeptide (TPR) repeat protein
MPTRPAKRLLIIGWDAADWIIINRLFSAGKMPNLRRLVEAGARADLGTLEPKLSPLLWTSIATGKTADKHGILNFVEPKPEGGGLRLSASTSRKTKALWNIFSQNGLTTNVIGWYASHPAEAIRGSVTTNMLQEGEPSDATAAWPLVAGTVHPATLASAISESRQRARSFPRDTLRELFPKVDELGASDSRAQTLAKLMAYASSIERAAIVSLTSGQPWDATMVFFDAIDTVGHHFMQFVAPKMAHVSERELRVFGGVMDRVYEWHDAALGRLLAAAGSDTTVMLLSDHGFHSDHLRPNLNDLPPERRMELESSWHRPYGVIVLSGPGITRGCELASPTILDVAPTALALLGLAAGDDFDGRVLSEALSSEVPGRNPSNIPSRIPSWDEVEGDAGLHPADLRQDPFEAADALQQLVDLGYMAALPSDVQAQVDLVRRESSFNLGVALMSRRRALEAIVVFEKLVAEKPKETRYALCLGNCLLSAGRFHDAAKCANAFMAQSGESLEAQMLHAVALALSGDDANARRETDAIERVVRTRPEMAISLAGILAACGRHNEARVQFEAAKKHNPRDAAAHVGLARTALALGEFEVAAEHALDALEITQALPDAHFTLGAALAWYGDLANAATSLGFALRHDAGLVDAHRFLALVHEKNGNATAASEARAHAEALIATVKVLPKESPFGPTEFAKKHALRSV